MLRRGGGRIRRRFGGREGRTATKCEGKVMLLFTLAHSSQGAGENILCEKSGECHLLGNTCDLRVSRFLVAFGFQSCGP